MKPFVHCHKAKNVTFCSSNPSVITRYNDELNDSEQCVVLLVHCSTRSLMKVTKQPNFLCLEPASALFLASYKLCNRCVCSCIRKKSFLRVYVSSARIYVRGRKVQVNWLRSYEEQSYYFCLCWPERSLNLM